MKKVNILQHMQTHRPQSAHRKTVFISQSFVDWEQPWIKCLRPMNNPDTIVVVVVIAQQLFSYHQLSRLGKSATTAGLSHRSYSSGGDQYL